MSEPQVALRELAAALRVVHERLLRATQKGFEKLHGRVGGSGELLQIALHDPLFAWLEPLTRQIAALDALAADAATSAADAERAHAAVAELLDADSEFRGAYLVYLQSDPDVVLAHAALRQRLAHRGDRPR